MKNTVSGMSYTGSYWLSAVPFAAGIACIEKMKKLDLPRILNEKGKKLGMGSSKWGKSTVLTSMCPVCPACSICAWRTIPA